METKEKHFYERIIADLHAELQKVTKERDSLRKSLLKQTKIDKKEGCKIISATFKH